MKVLRLATLFLPLVAAASGLIAANEAATAPAVAVPTSKAPTPTTKAPANTSATASPKSEKSEAAEFAALKAKAERGNAIAQYNLGLAFAQGRQTAVDLPEAFAWLTIAAQSGSTGKALDTVLGTMTPKQLTDGRRRLEELRSANPYLKPTVAATTAGGTKGGAPTPTATPTAAAAATAAGHPPSSTDEAKHLYDQLAAVTEEKRQLANELAVAKKELERAPPADSGSGRGRASEEAPPAQDSSAEVSALQAQLKEAQAALASRIELADRAVAKAQQAETLATERARALASAQAEIATLKAAAK